MGWFYVTCRKLQVDIRVIHLFFCLVCILYGDFTYEPQLHPKFIASWIGLGSLAFIFFGDYRKIVCFLNNKIWIFLIGIYIFPVFSYGNSIHYDLISLLLLIGMIFTICKIEDHLLVNSLFFVILIFVVASLMPAISTIIKLLLQGGTPYSYWTFFSSDFQNLPRSTGLARTLAFLSVISLSIFFGLRQNSPKIKLSAIGFLLCATISFFLLIPLGSRGGSILLITGYFAFFLSLYTVFSPKLVAVVCFFVALFIIISGIFILSMSYRYDISEGYDVFVNAFLNSSGRLQLWRIILEDLSLNLFGFGSRADKELYSMTASNGYLLVILKGGMLSFLALLGFMISLLHSVWMSHSYNAAKAPEFKRIMATALIIMILVRCIFENSAMMLSIDLFVIVIAIKLVLGESIIVQNRNN